MFITFEGGEGSGKTTQIKKLADALQQQEIPFVQTREPGGTEVGKILRQILLGRDHPLMDPMTELLLYTTDRAEHVRRLILPALKEKKLVLCDRFTDATLAYQGYGRGLDMKWIRELNGISTGDLKPDLTFLLDCPAEIGLTRSKARLERENSAEDRFEREHIAFHQRVREGYLQLAQAEPQRFRILDATEDAETIHQKILASLPSPLRGEGQG